MFCIIITFTFTRLFSAKRQIATIFIANHCLPDRATEYRIRAGRHAVSFPVTMAVGRSQAQTLQVHFNATDSFLACRQGDSAIVNQARDTASVERILCQNALEHGRTSAADGAGGEWTAIQYRSSALIIRLSRGFVASTNGRILPTTCYPGVVMARFRTHK